MANTMNTGVRNTVLDRNEEEEERRRREIAQANPVQPLSVSEAVHQNQRVNNERRWYGQDNLTQPQSATQQLRRKEMPEMKWYKGTTPTSTEIAARIYTIGQTDPEEAEDLWKQFQVYREDPNSELYNPYERGTNPALKELEKLGYDVGNGADAQWMANNKDLLKNLQFTSAGNVQAPTKRSTKEQRAAYYYYQLTLDEEKTQKAEMEWKALQEELSYWVGRTDLNLSDDEILDRIDRSQYKTLTGMDTDRETGVPTSLNRTIGYSDDALRGVLWAARNGQDLNDPYNSVKAALNMGKQYERDDEIHNKLDPSSPDYNPYSVSTMDDALRYFGVTAFDRDWCEQNRGYRTSNDETAQKMFDQVYKAEQTTRDAEDELEKLWAYVDRRLRFTTNPDKIIDGLLNNYPTLQKMNDTLGGGEILLTTRPVDFKLSAVEDKIREKCNIVNNAKHGVEFFNDLGSFINGTAVPMISEAAAAALESRSNNIDAAGDTILEKGTPAEQEVFEFGYDPGHEDNMLGLADGIDAETIDGQGSYAGLKSESDKNILSGYLNAHDDDVRYQSAEQAYNEAEANIALLEQGIIPDSLLPGGSKKKLTPKIQLTPGAGSETPLTENTPNYKTGFANYKNTLATREELLEFIPEAELDAAAGDPQKLRDLIFKYGVTEGPDSEGRGLPSQLAILQKGREETTELGEAFMAEEIQKLLNKQINIRDEAKATMDELGASRGEVLSTLQKLYDGDDAARKIAELTGADTTGGYDMFSILNRYYELGKEPVSTLHEAYSVYDQMLKDGADPATVQKTAATDRVAIMSEISEIDRMLKIVEEVGGTEYLNQEYFGSLRDGTPDYYNNILARRAALQNELQKTNYFQIRYNEDFGAVTDAAKEKIHKAWDGAWNKDWNLFGIDGTHDGYSRLDYQAADPVHGIESSDMPILTEEERNTYLYLRETQGADAAKEYYDYMVKNVVGARGAQALQETMEKIGKESWLGGAVGTAMSILASPLKVSGALYSLYSRITGQEIDPYNVAFGTDNFTRGIRGGVKQHLTNQFGEGSVGDFLSNFAFDAFTAAGDSLMNACMFGGIGESLSFTATSALEQFGFKAVQGLLGSIPMGLGAMSGAIQDAKLRGASDEQAMAMGGMVFLCETITEAVTLENIIGSEELGKVKNFKDFMKKVATEYLDEPLAEGLNEIMEGVGDQLIMQELSNWDQRVKELMDGGMLRKDAEAIAKTEFWEGVGYAAATGFLSSQVSNTFSYLHGRFGYKDTSVTTEEREQQVNDRGNVAEENTSDNSLQKKQEIDERQAQVDQNGNVVEENTSDNSLQKAQERAAREQQVDENGNVVEQDTSDDSLLKANERATREQQVDENGNVVEPDTSDNSVQQAQEIADRQAQVEENGNVAEPTQPVNSPRRTASQIVALEKSSVADPAAQTTTMAGVLLPKGKRDVYSKGFASASAHTLEAKYGTSAVKVLSSTIRMADTAGVSTDGALQTIATAAMMDEGSVSQQALDVYMNSGASLEGLMALTEAVRLDTSDPAVDASIKQKVKNHRIALKEKTHVGNGELKSVEPYEQNQRKAERERNNAQTELENAEKTQESLQENLVQVHEDFNQNPNDKNAALHNQATNAVAGQAKVVNEYEMRLDNAEADLKYANEQLDQKRDEALTPVREQATVEVAEEDAAERQQAAEALATLQAVDEAAKQAAVEQVAKEQAEAEQAAKEEKAKADYDKAVKKLPPKIPFGSAVEAKMENGRPVKLTGISYTSGSTTYYTTQDGKIVSSQQLQNAQSIFDSVSGDWDDAAWDTYEKNGMVPLDNSIKVNKGKGTKDVIGILSADPSGDSIQVLFSDGKTGNWLDLTPVKTGDVNTFNEVFEKNEQKLNDLWAAQHPEAETTEGGQPEVSAAQGELPEQINAAQGTLPAAQTQTNQSNKPVKSGQDIIRNLASALGIQEDSRIKKYLRSQRKKTLGYTINNGVIHILDAQSVKTAVHEIGHNLDQRLDMQGMIPDMATLWKNYENMYGTGFLNQYKPQQVPGELMAEFTRTWLQDRNSAVALAGDDVVRKFENALREHGYLKAMKEAATDFRLYDAASAVEREKAMIKMDGPEKERKSLSEAEKILSTKIFDGTRSLVDTSNIIRNAQGDSFNAAEDTRELLLANPNVIGNFCKSCLEGFQGKGLVNPQGDAVINPKTGEAFGALKDIFGKVNIKDMNDLVELWVALNAKERAAVDKGILSKDVDVDEVIKKLSAKHPEFESIINEFEDWYAALMQTWMVDTGSLEQSELDTMRQVYPHYIPAFTVDQMGKYGNSSRKTDSVVGSGIRRAKGHTGDIDNPIAHIASYIQTYIANAKQIEALRAFDGQMRYALENGLDLGGIAEPAQPDMKKVYQGQANQENRKAAKTALNGLMAAGSITPHEAQIVMDYLADIPDTTFMAQQTASGDDVINIPMPDGSIRSWTVYDPDIIKALMRTSDAGKIPFFLKAASKVTGFLAKNATSRSLPFVGQNFASDTPTAAATSQGGAVLPLFVGRQLTTALRLLHAEVADTAVGKKFNFKNDEAYRQFKLFGQLGHRYTFNDTKSREQLAEDLFGGKPSVGKVVGTILKSPILIAEKGSDFFEEVTRFNTFLHSGEDISTYEGRLKAGRVSRESTVDFSKRGTATADLKALSAVVPFLNAQLQGIYKTMRMFSKENEGNRAKTLGKIAVNSIFTSAVMAALRSMTWEPEEKEAYDNLSDYEKAKYWHIKNPINGRFFRIKRSQDVLLQMTDHIGNLIGDLATGYEGDELGAFAGLARETAKNMLVDMGTSFAPFIDAANNRTWYGGQIENYAMQQMSTGARYKPETRTSTRLLSYLFNTVGKPFGVEFSPLDVDYIENQFLGSMGSLGSGWIDAITAGNTTPGDLFQVFVDHLDSKFLVDPVYSNKLSNTFYDGKNRMSEILKEVGNGRVPEAFRYNLTEDEKDEAHKEASKLVSEEGDFGKAEKAIQKLQKQHDKILKDENLTQEEREAQAREIREQINKQYLIANAAVADFWNKYCYSNGLEQNMLNALNLFTNQKGNTIHAVQEAEEQDEAFAVQTKEAEAKYVDPTYLEWGRSLNEETGKTTYTPEPKRFPEWDGVAYEVKPEDWEKYTKVYLEKYNSYLEKKAPDWDSMTQKDREKLMSNARDNANKAARAWLQEQEGYDIPKKSK